MSNSEVMIKILKVGYNKAMKDGRFDDARRMENELSKLQLDNRNPALIEFLNIPKRNNSPLKIIEPRKLTKSIDIVDFDANEINMEDRSTLRKKKSVKPKSKRKPVKKCRCKK